MATAAFLRAAALGDAGPRAQRRAPADKDALLRILGHLGRIGNNVNQIARRLNEHGSIYETEIEDIQDRKKEIWETLNGILAKLEGGAG